MATTIFQYRFPQDANRIIILQNNIFTGDIEVQFDEGTEPVQNTWAFLATLILERRGGPRQGTFLTKNLLVNENTLFTEQEQELFAPLSGNLRYRLLARFRPFIPSGEVTIEFTEPP